MSWPLCETCGHEHVDWMAHRLGHPEPTFICFECKCVPEAERERIRNLPGITVDA